MFKSALREITDFLRKQEAQAPFPPDTLLVPMDVTSLYTNIPHQDGIQAYGEVWVERKVKNPSTRTSQPSDTHTQMQQLSSTVNISTAMGTKKWHLYTPIFSWGVSGDSC